MKDSSNSNGMEIRPVVVRIIIVVVIVGMRAEIVEVRREAGDRGDLTLRMKFKNEVAENLTRRWPEDRRTCSKTCHLMQARRTARNVEIGVRGEPKKAQKGHQKGFSNKLEKKNQKATEQGTGKHQKRSPETHHFRNKIDINVNAKCHNIPKHR